jgi:hypothetical protein
MTNIDPNDAVADIGGREKHLAAWWTFKERQGLAVRDAKGASNGTLQLTDPAQNAWSPNPDPSASSILLYLNGRPV